MQRQHHDEIKHYDISIMHGTQGHKYKYKPVVQLEQPPARTEDMGFPA